MDYDRLYNSSNTLEKLWKDSDHNARVIVFLFFCPYCTISKNTLLYFTLLYSFGVRRMANRTNPGGTLRWARSKAARHGQSYKAHARGRWLRTLPMSWCLDLRLVCCFTLSDWVATFSAVFCFEEQKHFSPGAWALQEEPRTLAAK